MREHLLLCLGRRVWSDLGVDRLHAVGQERAPRGDRLCQVAALKCVDAGLEPGLEAVDARAKVPGSLSVVRADDAAGGGATRASAAAPGTAGERDRDCEKGTCAEDR